MSRKTNLSISSKRLFKVRGYRVPSNNGHWWLIAALLIFFLPSTLYPAPAPSFQSLLTRDLTNLAPSTRFSMSDRIYLVTVWTGLKNAHQFMVHWVRPDQKIQETTRFRFSVPEGTNNYRTWGWLSFKKRLWNLSSAESKFIGTWKARLYLDDRFLAEHPFEIF